MAKAMSSMSVAKQDPDEDRDHGEHEGDAEELGDPEDPHLRAHRLEEGERRAAERQLDDEDRHREEQRRRRLRLRHSPGKEQREADARIGEELERGRPLDEREMAARVLEDHRLVDHRQLEVRRRVVDRHARVLGERHDGEGHAGERQARIDGEVAVRQRVDDRGERGGARDERGAEEHHEQRRLGKEADQHLAARAQGAERGTDVHRRERDEDPREGEQADQRDRVGGGRERQLGRERRHDGAGERHAAEHDVGRGAEQRRSLFGHHRILVEQLVQQAVGLQEGRRRLVLQPGAALVHPAGEQRREGERRGDLERLREHAEERHRATHTRTPMTVRKL
jgi:hypothetical protein